MYLISDKKSAIKEIQKFLFVISQREKSIPYVTVDGYYNDETRLAVAEFRKLYMHESTGKADKETYDRIYEIYLEAVNEKESSDNGMNSGNFPLKIGDSGSDVAILNAILSELSMYYRDLLAPYGDFFSYETENSVKEMQRHFLEKETGVVSEVFLGKLKKEVNIREKFKKGK